MRARLLIPFAAWLLLLSGCPTEIVDVSSDDDTGDDGVADDDTVGDLDAYILEQMDTGHIPGLAASIVRDGEIVWSAGYGWADIEDQVPVTPDTEFMLASVSKTVTAVALMQLWEDGLFELDDDVDGYLPFAVDNPTAPAEPITFRQLLTHTSSIEDNWAVLGSLYVEGDSPIPLGTFLEDYLTPAGAFYDADANFYAAAPGTFADYSNVGATLAGYLVEAITGTPFDQYCEANLFGPLQMDGAGWHLADVDLSMLAVPYRWMGTQFHAIEHYGYPDYPDGSLRCDVDELSHFLISFMEDGTWGTETILTPATVEEMRTVQYPALDSSQGLIWYYWTLSGHSMLGHNGGDDGATTDLFYRPDDGVGVIVLTNGDHEDGYEAMERIQVRLYEEAGGR